jgi:preprotein translocase subunit SecB
MPTRKKKHTSSNDRAYAEFVRHAELIAMGLSTSSVQLDRAAYMKLRREKNGLIRAVDVSFEVRRVKTSSFDGLAKYTLTTQDRQKTVQPLRIECAFDAHFHGPEPIHQALAERFIKSFLGVIVWPYFRQFVFDLSARMAIPPITLPLLPES